MFVLYSRVNLMINQGNHKNIRGYMDNLDENMSSSQFHFHIYKHLFQNCS